MSQTIFQSGVPTIIAITFKCIFLNYSFHYLSNHIGSLSSHVNISREMKLLRIIRIMLLKMLTCVWKILSGKYYQQNKERLNKSSWKIKNLSKEVKKISNMVANVTKNLSKGEKEKLVQYIKKYYRMRKNAL